MSHTEPGHNKWSVTPAHVVAVSAILITGVVYYVAAMSENSI